MPTYSYKCKNCNHKFSKLVSVKNKDGKTLIALNAIPAISPKSLRVGRQSKLTPPEALAKAGLVLFVQLAVRTYQYMYM